MSIVLLIGTFVERDVCVLFGQTKFYELITILLRVAKMIKV